LDICISAASSANYSPCWMTISSPCNKWQNHESGFIYEKYVAIIKPIWTYGIPLLGMASTSNIEILECFQSKALHMVVDTPWYVPNTVIQRDLQTPTVKEEIRRYSSQYNARLSAHPNGLTVNLMKQPENRPLQRHLPNDLPTRFLL
jgi:hypothetical protein